MKKKMAVIVLTMAAISAMTTNALAEDLLTKIQEKGSITIAMEGDWAPWSFHDAESNEVIGYDADVARALAEKLGVKIEIVEAPWESLFAGLDSARYDLVINGVEVTDERSEKYDFTDPYAYINTALIVRTDNEEITSFEDLEGKKTVNSLASTYMELAESYGATAVGVSTLAETLTQVLQGRADATLNADVSFYDYMNQHPDAELKIVATTEDPSLVAAVARKGEETEKLLEELNAGLKELQEDGTLKELSEKYFGSDISEK
ncbi:MAG: transporter substrate-binding domain-containing protein [Eubacteriales bacterium]|nr:transporter substrate-binding domain-containing protein [Eubacteriales bacterium]